MSVYIGSIGLQKAINQNVAFLEAKMLLLSIFLLSSCLSGSTGSAVEEFQANLEELVDLASKETFLPVPVGKFQCKRVPCHLERAMKQLKVYPENEQIRRHISLMKQNVARIISTLNKAHARPETEGSCQMTEMSPQNALKRYRTFFQKLHEKCYKPC